MSARLKLGAVAAALLALTACGGGGGGSDSSTTAPVTTPVANAGKLSGSAATGSALSGATVTLKDANGKTLTTQTNARGEYSFDTSALAAPFILKVEGGTVVTSGQPNQAVLYSIAIPGETTANLTTLTTLIVAQLGKQLPQDAFAAFSGALLDAAKTRDGIVAANNAVLDYLLNTLKLDARSIGNLITAKLDATGGNDPYDQMLEKARLIEPNIVNQAVALVKALTGTVKIDTANETLGQCIASLDLPADLKTVATNDSDLAVYTWDGQKKVDWSGAQNYKSGWFGGIQKSYFGRNGEQVALDGQQVTQTFDEVVVQEDATMYTPGASKTQFPFSYKNYVYTSLDGRQKLGWREDQYDLNGVATGYWLQKLPLAGGGSSFAQTYELKLKSPAANSFTRRSIGNWYSDKPRTEMLDEEIVFAGRETVDTLIGRFQACKSEYKATMTQKDGDGKTTAATVWTETVWHVPKLGAVKRTTTDLENDDKGTLVYQDVRNYDLAGARRMGQRYGAYDVWFGTQTGTTTTTAQAGSQCDYSVNGYTIGFNWLVKPGSDGKSAQYRVWDGNATAMLPIAYPGVTALNKFRTSAGGDVTLSYSQQLDFNLATGVLGGTYSRTEQYTGASCTGQYDYRINAARVL
ncbi:hypothetical protein [Jeongeupia chitinilytica]|uniref:Carboxypeptidase regulatory-like domain-containing protein n=1 Tax=Jeongeupia chitinilytica TaxID=1041641 RepID=A0ABQ3H767_9NEIS|nr:hypothetical protein [Jeongeupia chitinilytica]GHD69838.1 hypothetical protein GCM10007350_37090 [Jeongeupia chitinilytica]